MPFFYADKIAVLFPVKRANTIFGFSSFELPLVVFGRMVMSVLVYPAYAIEVSFYDSMQRYNSIVSVTRLNSILEFFVNTKQLAWEQTLHRKKP